MKRMKAFETLKKLRQNQNTLSLCMWILTLQVISYLIGLLTQINFSPWYNQLIKSALTPPPITFAIVWPLLYILLAILGSTIFSKNDTSSKKIQFIYSVQLILNWSWTPIFFYLHWSGTALLILAGMLALTSLLMTELHKKNKALLLLLVPYLIWITFATYLNTIIWINQ